VLECGLAGGGVGLAAEWLGDTGRAAIDSRGHVEPVWEWEQVQARVLTVKSMLSAI
jgi:hypothetical protein